MQDPRNYRGITLTSTFSKLLELLLKPNLERSLKTNNIPGEMQFGFQKDHSCMLTSCTLELVIECNTSQKFTTYVALLDAEKAFEKVWHEGLFHKIDKTNIDPAHSSLLRSLYENLESQVFGRERSANPYPSCRGSDRVASSPPSCIISSLTESWLPPAHPLCRRNSPC